MSTTTIKYYVNYLIRTINNSHLLAGLSIIFLNIGSKYIELGLTKTQEQALRYVLAREMLIFSMIFTATKDFVLSILMTGAFSAMTNHLFNEKSKYCILSEKLRRISYEVDLNNDGEISPEEEEHAIRILQKAKQQKKRNQQAKFTSYAASNTHKLY